MTSATLDPQAVANLNRWVREGVEAMRTMARGFARLGAALRTLNDSNPELVARIERDMRAQARKAEHQRTLAIVRRDARRAVEVGLAEWIEYGKGQP